MNEEQKRFRNLANRNWRALKREFESNGWYSDGSGKRYRIGVYYVLSGDALKAQEFYHWYESEFPDDAGEPVALLYRVLAEYRCGSVAEASAALLQAMFSNLYMLPYLFDEPIAELDIWHGSNRDRCEYLDVIAKFLDEPTIQERAWIKDEYLSESLTHLRLEYIRIHHELNHERDVEKRKALAQEWRTFVS